MKTRILTTLMVLLCNFALFGQAPGLVAGNLNITNFPAALGGGKFQVSGTFSDPTGRWFAADVDTGMIMWKGNDLFKIDSILVRSGSSLTFRVQDTYNVGFIATGNAQVLELSPNLKIPGVAPSGDSNSALTPAPDHASLMNYILRMVDEGAGKVRKDTTVLVDSENRIIDFDFSDTRKFENVYFTCKGITDAAIVTFLNPPDLIQRNTVFHVKSDFGLVQVKFFGWQGVNHQNLYNLLPGQRAEIKGLYDAVASNYLWDIALLWDSYEKKMLQKDTFYFVLSGQSNALGASAPYDGDTTGNAAIQVWDEFSGAWKRATIGQAPFRSALHPQTLPTSEGSNNIGFQFAKEIHAQTGKIVRFLIVAEDGASGRGHIGRWTTTGNKPVWDRLVARVDSAKIADPNFKRLDAFLWHQGESDYASTYTYYRQRFDTLKKHLRLKNWFRPNTPIVVGGLYLPNTFFNVQDTTLRTFDFDSDYWVAYASSENLSSDDNLHFDGESLVELGSRYYNAFASLPKRYTERRRPLNSGLISELPKGDVSIEGAVSSDLKIKNTRIQFEAKLKVGDDSTFSHSPADSLTKIRGEVELKNGSFNAINSGGFYASGSGNYSPALSITNTNKANTAYSKRFVYDNSWGNYSSPNGVAVGDAWYSDRINYQWGQIVRWDSIAGQGWVMDNIFGPNFLPACYYFRGGSAFRGGEFVFQNKIPSSSTPSILLTDGLNTKFAVLANGECVISSTLWLNTAKTIGVFTGTGSPEGVVIAGISSVFHRINGGAGTSFYVKESGTGATGWVAK